MSRDKANPSSFCLPKAFGRKAGKLPWLAGPSTFKCGDRFSHLAPPRAMHVCRGGCLAGQPARTLARAALVHSGAARELRSGLSTGRAMAPAIVRGASRGRNTCMHPDLATERAHPDHLAAGSSGLRGSGRSGRCACAGQRTPRVDGHSPFFGHLHHWPDHSALTAIPSLISPSNGISRAPAVSRMQA